MPKVIQLNGDLARDSNSGLTLCSSFRFSSPSQWDWHEVAGLRRSRRGTGRWLSATGTGQAGDRGDKGKISPWLRLIRKEIPWPQVPDPWACSRQEDSIFPGGKWACEHQVGTDLLGATQADLSALPLLI